MPYSEPYSNEECKYGMGVNVDQTVIPGGNADIVIQVLPSQSVEGAVTEVGMDEVTQRLVDLLAGSGFLIPLPGLPVITAYKTQRVTENSEATPTEEP